MAAPDLKTEPLEIELINKSALVKIEYKALELLPDGGAFYIDRKPGGQRTRLNVVTKDNLACVDYYGKCIYVVAQNSEQTFKSMTPTGETDSGMMVFAGAKKGQDVLINPKFLFACEEIKK